MLANAITLPTKVPAIVAELPTCQCTPPQEAPLVNLTAAPDDVISVLGSLKT